MESHSNFPVQDPERHLWWLWDIVIWVANDGLAIGKWVAEGWAAFFLGENGSFLIFLLQLCEFAQDFQPVISNNVQEGLGKFHFFAACCADTSTQADHPHISALSCWTSQMIWALSEGTCLKKFFWPCLFAKQSDGNRIMDRRPSLRFLDAKTKRSRQVKRVLGPDSKSEGYWSAWDPLLLKPGIQGWSESQRDGTLKITLTSLTMTYHDYDQKWPNLWFLASWEPAETHMTPAPNAAEVLLVAFYVPQLLYLWYLVIT